MKGWRGSRKRKYSITVTMCSVCLGPLASALANYFGSRKVAMGGTLLAVAGFLMSLVAPKLWVLYLTFGVMGGTSVMIVHSRE